MKILATFILLFGLSCNGSKDISKQDAMAELGGTYNIVAMGSDDMSGKSMTLVFDPATSGISGSSSCNKLFGSYSAEGETLSFSKIGMTKMYCDGKMDVEQSFLQAMQAVNNYNFNGDQVQLRNDDIVLLTLSK